MAFALTCSRRSCFVPLASASKLKDFAASATLVGDGGWVAWMKAMISSMHLSSMVGLEGS